jgi:hypothetical protein
VPMLPVRCRVPAPSVTPWQSTPGVTDGVLER